MSQIASYSGCNSGCTRANLDGISRSVTPYGLLMQYERTQMWDLWDCCYGNVASCFMVHLVFSFCKEKAVHTKVTMKIYLVSRQASRIVTIIKCSVSSVCAALMPLAAVHATALLGEFTPASLLGEFTPAALLVEVKCCPTMLLWRLLLS